MRPAWDLLGEIDGREPFQSAARRLLEETGVSIRRWRRTNTGVAYVDDPHWAIEAPHPRGPVSFSTLAHEVGHQILHRHGSKPRWREELEAWQYAIEQFRARGLPGLERAHADAERALARTAARAARRGLDLPTILAELAVAGFEPLVARCDLAEGDQREEER